MKTRTNYALITGASRGIGRAIAEKFAEEGYHLFLTCSKTMEELETLAEYLSQKNHVTCLPFRCDMGNSKNVEQLFVEIQKHTNSLDVLINNAGISHIGLLSDMADSEWQRLISVNLSSCFYTCKQAIPMMLKSHSGRIINISSVWGNTGASMEVAYSASKGGMNSFTKALAKELAPSNIQVNAIACGVIDTSMNSCFSPDEMEALRQEIPADRIGTVNEVACLAFQLAEAPSYLTGQIITLDGGFT